MKNSFCLCNMLLFLVISCVAGSNNLLFNEDCIQPYIENPRYWQYKGKPVLLIGGSKNDNLFQSPDIEEHLDLLVRVGGNYIRNVMSSRDAGDVQPFFQLTSGKFDLNRFNPEYWQRFENLLKLASERDIIVQIEVWDRFDYARDSWEINPYNPKNNINYTDEASGLEISYPKHPAHFDQPFFFTVPELNNNTLLLKYQETQVAKMLSYSLKYGNILYTMDNETRDAKEWGEYWSNFIKKKANELGVQVYTTEMWDENDLTHEHHRRTLDHPETYDFVDISQNSRNMGQRHWDNMQWVYAYLADKTRPMNNVKIYGGGSKPWGSGTAKDGIERFWRNIIGGCATARFHRDASGTGTGLQEISQSSIRSMRLLTSELDIFNCKPDSKSKLLSDRSANEAYLTYIAGKQYAIYFPNGGEVTLDLSHTASLFTVKWLDINNCKWQESSVVEGSTTLNLQAPSSGDWIVLLKKLSD